VTLVALQPPDALRLMLLLGLVVHKGVWEVLKRAHGGRMSRAHVEPVVRVVKSAKLAVLAFLIVQTICLEILPIAREPGRLRSLGGALFMIGLAVAIIARVQLGQNWMDLEDARVLPEQSLVQHGLYRYVRHPIYTGDLLLLAGLELALNSWLVLAVGLMAVIVVRQSLVEEAMLARRMPGYPMYCARTKRFIPFVV
jgi:protein-S-isoprenylcysteine O-methyltransferase Ste14